MKCKFSFLLLICFGLFFILPGNAQSRNIIQYNIPIVETFDLLQDGSTTTYKTNISKSFDVVTKMNWVLNFDDNSLDWNNFAANDSSLGNGIYVNYDEGNMIDSNYNITNNWQLINLAYNSHHFTDDKNPVGQIIWVQHLLTSFIGSGIIIDDSHTISVWVQDDLTDVNLHITSFTVTFKGYQTIQQQIYNPQPQRQDPLSVFFSFIWRDNQPTLELFVIFLISAGIVYRFWKRR